MLISNDVVVELELVIDDVSIHDSDLLYLYIFKAVFIDFVIE